MLGYAGVVISESIEVYEGFGDREWKGRMVACGGVFVSRGGWEMGSLICGISARRALWSLYSVLSLWKWWAGARMLLSVCALASDLVAS